MAKERALTLEALCVMDAIHRRCSFAAAADELARVSFVTVRCRSWRVDVVLFDRSGHRTSLMQRWAYAAGSAGAYCWKLRINLTTDAEALARGWETHLTIVTEALVPTAAVFAH